MLLPLPQFHQLFILLSVTGQISTLVQVDIQEYNDNRYVINRLAMLLPLSQCRRHQGVGGSLRSVLLVERENNVGDLLVRQELPDTVTRQQYDFILRRERRLGDIRLG